MKSPLTPQHTCSTTPTPAEILQVFCQSYTLDEVQNELWRCLQPRLLEHLTDKNPDPKRLTLYENLEILLSAVYQLPDLLSEAAQEEVTKNADTAALAEAVTEFGPVTTALESLRRNVPQSWTLLICPPE